MIRGRKYNYRCVHTHVDGLREPHGALLHVTLLYIIVQSVHFIISLQ